MGMGHLAVAPGATASASSLLIRANSGGRYLETSAGTPWLMVGEACWCANTAAGPSTPNAKGFSQNSFMADRQSKGMNCFSLQLISRYQTNAPNDYNSVAPFSTPNDIRTPNTTYFALARDMVQRAATYGLVVLIAPCWFGYDSGQGWYNQLNARTNGEIQAYASYVASYFYDLDNVIWINGGDMPGAVDLRIPNAISAGIRAIDTRHLITAHWNFQPSDAHVGDWLDFNGCYDWNSGNVWDQVESQYANNDGPVVVLEDLYKDNVSFGWTRKLQRFQQNSSMLAGAKGRLHGEEGNWHSGSADTNLPSQSQGKDFELNSSEVGDFLVSMNLLKARAWHLLVPSPEGSSTLITSSRSSGNTFIAAAKTATGNLCIVYVPNGGSVTVALSQLSGTLTTKWYDPTTTTAGVNAGAGSYPASGTQAFTVPGNNAAGDNDWLLVLES